MVRKQWEAEGGSKKPLNRTLMSDFGQSPIPNQRNNNNDLGNDLGTTFQEK